MPPHRGYLLEYLHGLAEVSALSREADARLLERFTRAHDEDAFGALVARHALMVLRVCRRVLADPDAAQDACQATFCVLALCANGPISINSGVRQRNCSRPFVAGEAEAIAEDISPDLVFPMPGT